VVPDPEPSGSSVFIPSSPRKFSRTLLTLSADERQIDISVSVTPDREETYSLRQVRCSVTNASPTTSSNRLVPVLPPHHSPPPSNLPPAPLLELLDEVTIDSVPDGTVQPRKGRRRPGRRRGFSHMQDDIPVPKLDYDLSADFGER
jgi:hypothetical protein